MRLGLEVDAATHDVLRGRELVGTLCGLRLQTHLEATETVQLHAIASVKRLRHHYHQFPEHGNHIRFLCAYVVLDVVCQFLEVPVAQALCLGVPLILSRTSGVLVLIQYIKSRHNLNVFLVVNLLFRCFSLRFGPIVARPAA